jgi:hypothetical protein
MTINKVFVNPNSNTADKINNLIEIYPGIWLYKNFLSADTEKSYVGTISSMTEQEWDSTHFNYVEGDQELKFWYSRVSKHLWPFEQLYSTLNTFFAPEYWITGAFRFFCRMRTTDSAPTIIECLNKNHNNDHYNFFAKWKIGLYFGEFTGGSVLFPDFNFSVDVKPRDMLVWSHNYNHSVSEVTSGIRYSYSDFLIKPFDHFFA